MDASFKEKSQWIQLVSLIIAFGLYFGSALPSASLDIESEQVTLFVAAVILLVVMQIVGFVVLAIVDRDQETDERDRLIELRSTRNASYVLSTGVFLSLWAAVLTEGDFVFTHLLLASWVLAQLVELALRLHYYRKGF